MKWVCLVLLVGVCGAQEELQKRVPKVVPVPVPRQAEPEKAPVEPTNPPARQVDDARTGISLRLPAGWVMTRKDGEVSTFLNDARSAPKRSQVRLAASLGWNPFPHSTFSGALFYLTVAPHSSKAACAAQTQTAPDTAIAPAVIDDVRFLRGKDEHGRICTQARDIAYTSFRGGMCVRFDLAVNNFCGGDVSGAQEITDAELGNVFGRMEGILQTVKFTKR